MGDMLSQAEIDALLGGSGDFEDDGFDDSMQGSTPTIIDPLTDDEKDALGEIGNISMGTAATTLFTLLNQKVTITTPKVKVTNWSEIAQGYTMPCVAIKVEYKEGLLGANVLLLKEEDVKIIADLMMGGDGTNISGELSELHLSAIGEAMNQMVGSASTSMSSMFHKKIDIMPPNAFILDLDEDPIGNNVGFGKEGIVRISFRMEIGNLIDSEIMQILPVDFAKDLVSNLINAGEQKPETRKVENPTQSLPNMNQPIQAPPFMPQQSYEMNSQQPMMGAQPQYMPPPQQPYMMPQQQAYMQPQQNINAQPAQFQNFDFGAVMQQKENIGIIMDVPLEVTVELGRTHKLIKEILEFSPGTIIELDKLAGEPIDILVNGKFVAKGEVVVIDENFGIRITDIVSTENRI